MKKPAKRKIAKRYAKKKPLRPAKARPANPDLEINYRRGAVKLTWVPGDAIPQALRDTLAKHVPPLTLTEKMAVETRSELNQQLSDSLKPPIASDPEPQPPSRPKTISELQVADEDKTDNGRPDLVG